MALGNKPEGHCFALFIPVFVPIMMRTFPAAAWNPSTFGPIEKRQWQRDAETWERKPVAKLRFLVALEDGQALTLFKNMEHGGWYQLVN